MQDGHAGDRGVAQHGFGLELDELLGQLIERAEGVRSAHQRLRGLLEANRNITANLSLETVLSRIVESGCELLKARYGALGVLSPDGHGLEQFVHVGIDEATVASIGDLPQGKGVLGALIEDPAPITLGELSNDPRSVGFPEGHPPMHTFLGVPIEIRGEVFGNLYLTEREEGDFTPEDVELASALASTAAVAIENARLFEDARRRQEWLRAAAEASLAILTEAEGEPLRVVADRVRRLAGADVATVVLPEADGTRLAVEVAVGMDAEQFEGRSFPAGGTLSEQVLQGGEAARIDAATPDGADCILHLRELLPIGPAMVLPLAGRGSERARGALAVGRLASGRAFSDSELEMAATFANQAALALELAESRTDRERMQLFEERDRIARDLHDHVIQQLFAAGLTLQGISMGMGGGPQAERIERVVESLDDSIQQIRNSIFELRDHMGPQGPGARAAVLEVAGSIAEALGFEPEARFAGPVDTMVDAALAEDLTAVVREALTNIARHAGATRAEISLTCSTERLELRIADNGCGIPESGRRSGLANMAARAERRGGSFSAGEPREGTGTVLLWVVPMRA